MKLPEAARSETLRTLQVFARWPSFGSFIEILAGTQRAVKSKDGYANPDEAAD